MAGYPGAFFNNAGGSKAPEGPADWSSAFGSSRFSVKWKMSQFQVSNLFENINLVPLEQEQRFLITLGGENNFAKH